MDNKRDQFENNLLDVALEGLKAIRAFLAYAGSNPDYLKRAKIGSIPVTSYTRLRATMANERVTELVARRMELDGENKQPPKQLTA